MSSVVDILQNCALFAGIAKPEIEKMLCCLNPREQKHKKGALLFQTGESIGDIFILLSGKIQIIKENFDGNIIILAHLDPGDLFGEAFAYSGSPLAVTAEAGEDCTVLQMDCRKILSACASACNSHEKFISNLISAFAQKNIFLTERIEHLSKRTLREKVLSYLTEQARLCGNRTFIIPFDRQGLADYLAVDRSALSFVLSKLRDEGVLTFYKNKFTLQ